MKRLKAFGARRQRRASFDAKNLSQVVGIESPPTIASSPRRDEKESAGGSSFSSSISDVQQHASSRRLSNASELVATTSSSQYGSSSNIINGGGPRAIVVAFDANARDAMVGAVAWAFQNVLKSGDLLAVLGVMDFLRGPLGYKCQVNSNDQTWLGANVKHLRDEIALQKLSWAATPGLQTLCETRGVKLVVNVKAAARPELVIVQDAIAFGAVQVVLDKSLKTQARQRKFYMEHLSCEVTRMRRSGGEDIIRLNLIIPTSAAAAPAVKANSDDEELFTIDHCRHGDGGGGGGRGGASSKDEEGYESDDLFSICDEAWQTSSFAAQLMQRESARRSTVSMHDYDPAMASFVPPRSSVEFGPLLDKRLLSLRLQLRDSNLR